MEEVGVGIEKLLFSADRGKLLIPLSFCRDMAGEEEADTESRESK
jgi:hypothetical protein